MNSAPIAASSLSPGATSRRNFLARGGALVATALLCPPMLAESSQPLVRERSLNELCLAMFAEQVQTGFEVTDFSGGSVRLKLVEATAGTSLPGRADAHHEKFSLIFSGPKTPLLAQRIYRLEHLQIGRFEIFLVPIVTRADDRQHYQAVFNRPFNQPVSFSETLLT